MLRTKETKPIIRSIKIPFTNQLGVSFDDPIFSGIMWYTQEFLHLLVMVSTSGSPGMFHHLFQKPLCVPCRSQKPLPHVWHWCVTTQPSVLSVMRWPGRFWDFFKLEEKPIETTCQLNPAESSRFFFCFEETGGKRNVRGGPSYQAFNIEEAFWDGMERGSNAEAGRPAGGAICLIVFIVFPLKMVININIHINR